MQFITTTIFLYLYVEFIAYLKSFEVTFWNEIWRNLFCAYCPSKLRLQNNLHTQRKPNGTFGQIHQN